MQLVKEPTTKLTLNSHSNNASHSNVQQLATFSPAAYLMVGFINFALDPAGAHNAQMVPALAQISGLEVLALGWTRVQVIAVTVNVPTYIAAGYLFMEK